MAMKLDAPMTDARLLSIACGTRSNVVPGTATALLAGDWRVQAAEAFDSADEDCAIETALEGENTRVTVTGVPAHASPPEQGQNAGTLLLPTLPTLALGGSPVALGAEAAGEVQR